MISTWIVLKDNKILRSFEAESEEAVIQSLKFFNLTDYDEIRNTKQTNSLTKGADIREYDNSYALRPEIERIADGLIDAPKGKKLNGNKTELIDKTIKEKIDSGELELSEYQIYDEDTKQIRQKTYIELYKDGLIEFDKVQKNKINEILSAFEIELQNGHFMSITLGIEVDCRRSNVKNDKQNVEGLISNMSRKNKSTINYVGYTETCFAVTAEQLTELTAEMEDYFLALYEKKWNLQTQIENATTTEDIESIVW